MAATQQEASRLKRPKGTAEHFHISGMTLHRWRKQDGFPQPLRRGQVVLYDVQAIEQWLADGDAT